MRSVSDEKLKARLSFCQHCLSKTWCTSRLSVLHFMYVTVVFILQVMDVRSLSHDSDSEEAEEEEEDKGEEGEGTDVVVSEKETALLMANAVT